MSIILGLLGSVASRVVGAHLFQNHAASAGIGTLQSVVEGMGMRFFLGMGTAFYISNDGFRHAVNQAGKALIGIVREGGGAL